MFNHSNLIGLMQYFLDTVYIMFTRLNQLQQSDQTLELLTNGIKTIWEVIPVQNIDNLIMRLPNQVTDQKRARGAMLFFY